MHGGVVALEPVLAFLDRAAEFAVLLGFVISFYP